MTYVIPIIVLFIIVYSYKKKVNIYDEFLVGAKEGVGVAFNLVPSVVAMVLAINIFVRSGILEFFLSFLPNVGIPIEALSMAPLRPISGNAALAMMNQVFTLYGPDSYAGYLASIIQGCTDTTIYVLALYFGSVKITKTRHALWAGLFADFCGLVAAFVLCYIFFR